MKALICACCNARTIGKQWWNRDEGFGVCPRCAYNEDQEQVQRMYGKRGEHFATELDKDCQPGMLVGWVRPDGSWAIGTLKKWQDGVATIKEHRYLFTGDFDRDVAVRVVPCDEG